MIVLQSFKDSFSQYGMIDDNDTFKLVFNKLEANFFKQTKGFFYFFDQSVFALIKTNKEKKIYYNGKWLELNQKTEISYKRINEYKCQLAFLYIDTIVFSIQYYQENYGSIERIGHTEDESDYNFGLWLYKNQLLDEESIITF